ncbi:Chemoreceptor glutamine deamidase CheD [bioreactor metagenome]|uniref:Chemoreceptor glutamine deamidase CheD n=1 Tax=bioreactor metagenome TaxID=1076179 RepID=A0A645AJU0_9ZZZZ
MADLGIIMVGIGDCAIARSPVKIKTSGLGSCLGITLYDREEKIGGLLHTMLPNIKDRRIKDNPAKFTDAGIEYLLDEIIKRGGSGKKLEAKIVGGAGMFENSCLNIGKRNIKSARETMEKLGLSVIAEDTGKNYGRTVIFNTFNGEILIKTVLKGDKVI